MTFAEVVANAVKDFTYRGFLSEQQLEYWMSQIREAAERETTSAARMQSLMASGLRAIYTRLVDREGVLRNAPGVDRFTLQRVAPRLRAELDRRIMASANLIKLNRTQMIEKTLQRFSGWATSVPQGGASEPAARATAEDVKKSMRGLPFLERRVLIDQGHKLTSSINSVVAEGGGAIAGMWLSHWRQLHYNYREDHKERDQHIYLIRDSWAHQAGFIKPSKYGYTDEVTQPAEEVFCRCKYKYLFHLRQMPDDMLTAKGRKELERVRVT